MPLFPLHWVVLKLMHRTTWRRDSRQIAIHIILIRNDSPIRQRLRTEPVNTTSHSNQVGNKDKVLPTLLG